MEGFDDIRPYRDEEVAGVLARLIDDDELIKSAAAFLAPWWYRCAPPLTKLAVRQVLRGKTRRLRTVDDVQVFLSRYFERLIHSTTDGFTFSGLESLGRSDTYLFLSNHRDIAMDSGFMNYALWSSGFETSQIAVGDNLFRSGFATDLMRLNKSFVVDRSARGAKAQFAALSTTSSYIRSALEQGESVWIAQREGRAKDGLDRTDPAILKMFMLAYRKEVAGFGEWLGRVSLVPVSVSYELDPCAPMKARELYIRESQGEYQKGESEDLDSIVSGMIGFKGRVHVAFAPPVRGEFADDEALAEYLDRAIARGIQTFATFRAAERLLDTPELELDRALGELSGRVREEFEAALEAMPTEHRPFFLLQYANQIRNQRSGSAG